MLSCPAHNRKDLSGKKFGELLVTDKTKKTSSKKLCWLCKCSCGHEIWVLSTKLMANHTKSCGCLRNRVGENSPRYQGYKEISHSNWGRIKKRAQERNINFDLNIKDAWDLFIKQNRKCRFTGIDLYHSKTRHGNWNASLDRIDSSKGYTIDNVQWIDKRLQKLKNNLSDKDFIELCHFVSKNCPMDK